MVIVMTVLWTTDGAAQDAEAEADTTKAAPTPESPKRHVVTEDGNVAPTVQPPARAPASRIEVPHSPTDTINGDTFRRRHAFSLDHFFEMWPRTVIGRQGPIGAEANYSRYGVGYGRGAFYLGSVPLNDPQDDRMPLGLVPTTPIGELSAKGQSRLFLPARSNIEGVYQIVEPPMPTDKPVTWVELSKGDRNLRQRRLKFSSIVGPVGIDFYFDELLNDGYAFDGREKVNGSDYGKSTTRTQGGNIRGRIPGGEGYLFSFRRFTHTFEGDLISADRVHRRDGHYALLRSGFGAVDLSVFERSHKTQAEEARDLSGNIAAVDSSSANHTAGAFLSWPFSLGGGSGVTLGAGYEDVHSKQEIGDVTASNRLQKAHLGVTGSTRAPWGFALKANANTTYYVDSFAGWGADLTFGRSLGSSNRFIVELKRGFRMPNLSELYQPLHSVFMEPTIKLTGNRYVKDEHSLEASAAWYTRFGILENEIRGTGIRMQNPIVFNRVEGEAVNLRSAQNGVVEDLFVVEERLGIRESVLTMDVELSGGIEYCPSVRERYFASVPGVRASAVASIGRDIFKNTSGFRLSAEYKYGGSRKAGSTHELPSYNVVNVKLVFRLIDANIYLQWLNVSDTKYVTVWPFLMPPRTFVYGIEWSIFD